MKKEKDDRRKGYVLIALSIIIIGLIIGLVLSAQGTTWTTKDCLHGATPGDTYKPGDQLYIYGKNFDPGTYHWSITGQPGSGSCHPGQVIAEGDYYFDSAEGETCFRAYIIKNRECGEYKVDFAGKTNNYKIEKNFCALEVYGKVYFNETGGVVLGNFPIQVTCRHPDGSGVSGPRMMSESDGNYSMNFVEGTCAEGDEIVVDGYKLLFQNGEEHVLGGNGTATMVCNTQIDLIIKQVY